MAKKRNRKHSKIDKLPESTRETVEQMLLTGATYGDIVDYLQTLGVGISMSSVCRYAQAYNANVEMLNIAQENFRRMMSEMEKYPDLDTTEAIIRLASQNVFNALAQTQESDWSKVSVEKMVREATALIRAAAYKKRIEVQNQTTQEIALEEVKGLAFAAMRKEKPELYAELAKYLNAKKKEPS